MPEATLTTRPPKLSDLGLDLLDLTKWQVMRTVASPFVALAAFWILADSEHWTLAVLAVMFLSFITYGSTSHDLVHGSLGLKRLPNDILLSVIEVIALRSGHAYQAAHLNHHARFPDKDDIGADAARMSPTRALLEGVIFEFRIYAWALQNPRGKRSWIIGEGITALPSTIIPAVYVGLMIAGSWTIPFFTSYIPHNSEGADVLHQTRVFRGPIARIVAIDHLYHLEHHLYPAVPHHNWPRLARHIEPWLLEV